MRNNHRTYCVFLDVASHPQMCGIRGMNGIYVGQISTDFQKINWLAGCYNSVELSPVHLTDVMEDFRHSWKSGVADRSTLGHRAGSE